MTTRTLLLALILAWMPGLTGAEATDAAKPERSPEASDHRTNTMKISLKVEKKAVTGTLIDNETTRDFVSLLPLTLTMNDLFGREKFGHLPRATSEGGPRTKAYQVGEVVYWSPGPDVAIFYRYDGHSIPSPGIIVMGRIDSGVEALNAPGSVRVSIERLDN